jgi:hypothetical protein
VLAHACINEPEVRQAIFEELDVVHRVELVTQLLK